MTDSVYFWRRTPPVLFPACLGALSLALAWRRGSDAYGLPWQIGEAVLLVAGLVFAFIFLSYTAKLMRRPSVILQDISPHPVRAVASAGSMGLMVLAAGCLPWSETAAHLLWWAGLVLHAVYAWIVAALLAGDYRRDGWRGLPLTPALFLPFVGQVTAPLAGVSLGYVLLSAAILYLSLIVGGLLVIVLVIRLISAPVPLPVRPSQAIYLAPLALCATDAALLGHPTVFMLLFFMALLIACLLALNIRWMTEGGWTPGWAAFTFPLGTLAGVCLLAESRLPGLGAGWIGIGVLILASAVIPWILWRSLHAWASGRLARATGAAEA